VKICGPKVMVGVRARFVVVIMSFVVFVVAMRTAGVAQY